MYQNVYIQRICKTLHLESPPYSPNLVSLKIKKVTSYQKFFQPDFRGEIHRKWLGATAASHGSDLSDRDPEMMTRPFRLFSPNSFI